MMNISQSDASKAEKKICHDDESSQKDASDRERDAELVKRCQSGDYAAFDAVSYTHLTLPTIVSV